MKVTINDHEETLDRDCTVQQLLVKHGLASAPCAVEVNRTIVPKRRHAEHALRDGDHVEIVTLVGGG